MDTLIGFLELLGWALVVLALACVVTYGVIRLTKVWEARREANAAAAGPKSS